MKRAPTNRDITQWTNEYHRRMYGSNRAFRNSIQNIKISAEGLEGGSPKEIYNALAVRAQLRLKHTTRTMTKVERRLLQLQYRNAKMKLLLMGD